MMIPGARADARREPARNRSGRLNRAAALIRSGGLVILTAVAAAACEAAPDRSISMFVELTEVLSVGLVDGPEEQVFGQIRDVRGLPDGSFLVLDGQAPAIRWFDPEGNQRAAVTSQGEGPGELAQPVAMTTVDEDRLGVLDPGNQRLLIFRLEEEGFSYDTSIRVSLNPYGMYDGSICGLADRWVVHALASDGSTMQVYTQTSGEREEGFQEAVPVDEAEFGMYTFIAEPSINSGRLLCSGAWDRIISVPLRQDTVRAFSASGSPVWQHAVKGIVPEGYQVEPVFGFASESGGSHVAVSAMRWDETAVLVQYRFWRGSRTDPDSTAVESVVLDPESGEELGRTESLPRLSDARGPYVWGFEHEPFPRVRVWRREGG